MLLPALSKAKSKAKSIACTSNLHQMALAWHQYTLDNNDVMPPSMTPGANIPEQSYPGCWVLGNAQTDTDTTNIQAGVLYRYTSNPALYRCPADSSVVSGQLRTRSYSMNWWLNGDHDVENTRIGVHLQVRGLGRKLDSNQCTNRHLLVWDCLVS